MALDDNTEASQPEREEGPRFPLAPGDWPAPRDVTSDWMLETFLGYVESIGLELYPAQEEAILEITSDKNVILNTPTGSGKSLVGLAACFCALARGERAFYTAPIKALVSEKFLALCRVFGPAEVGMMTGDATVNHDAPIICCTAEILSNLALREGRRADVGWAVMDEFHYYSDRDRGVAWQIPLLTLSDCRFVLMSATLGDTKLFEQTIADLTGEDTTLVKSKERPVPLDWSYVETPLHETVQDLMKQGRAPVYIVHFSQRAASEQAQKLTSLDFLDKEQKQVLKEELRGFRFSSAFGKELARFIPHGIGVHHAGMLPKYRLLVEKLAQKGLLKVICGTDTLGVGVNIPLRTVLFTQLCKYDGEKTKLLTVRDFQQIAGRAGRRGFDVQGSVVVQAPEHVIENKRMKDKAAGDPKKLKKLRPKKEPDRGYAPWDDKTMEKLRSSEPEALVSRFSVGSGMLLNVLCRPEEDGCKAMKRLIEDSHETDLRKRKHKRQALSIFRALLEADIVELDRQGVRVHADLQEDFSLNQALSLYAVEVIDSLDRNDRNYALLALSVVEGTLENPGVILKHQVNTLKGRKIQELKHQGIEYDERMAELEKVWYPMPEREFLYATFDAFAEQHPWVLGHRILPKSIARDMYELGLSFNGYVKEYGLQRGEGVLLRYLSECYRALQHTVPDGAKTEELLDVIEWLEGELKSADASLLEEWKRLSDPQSAIELAEELDHEPEDITRDHKGFTVLLRNVVWRVVQAIAKQDFDRTGEMLVEVSRGDRAWTSERLSERLSAYFAEYAELLTDPSARSPKNLSVEMTDGATWTLTQSLVDPEGDLGWSLEFEVDLASSAARGEPVLRMTEIHAG